MAGHGRPPRSEAGAIVVAGGSGTRFGGNVRKQYLRLGGKPILWWSLRAFEESPSFGAIVAVVRGPDVEKVRAESRRWNLGKLVQVTAGGATRRESVARGLAAMPREYAWVAVHDAVRPLITPEAIEKVLDCARAHQAAIAACPSRDTVKLADDRGRIAGTPPRERVWLAQTPQIFSRELLERAHAGSPGVTATDDAQLVEAVGGSVQLVETSPTNMKVTVPMDFEIAKMLLKKGR